TPPASLEDRSEWYTVLSWYPGTLHGRSQVTIRTRTTAHEEESLPGLHDGLSRLPGDYYTAYTRTIEHVPGIEEAIHFLDMTGASAPNLPPGDLGLAERWIAYLHGVLEEGSCSAPGMVDGAAWAWNSGVADCDGF